VKIKIGKPFFANEIIGRQTPSNIGGEVAPGLSRSSEENYAAVTRHLKSVISEMIDNMRK
jgi:hypothetical protein